MPIQTEYGYDYPQVLPGMTYDLRPKTDVTAASKEAIEFGIGVAIDPTIEGLTEGRLGVKLPAGASDVFAGVTKFDHKQPTRGTVAKITELTTTEGALYEPGDPIGVRTKGSIMVYTEQAVQPGDPVFWRHTVNGAGTAKGYFRKDADTARAIDVSDKVKWVGRTDGAGRVAIEVNLP